MPRPGSLSRAFLRLAGGALALWTLARIVAYFFADGRVLKHHVESVVILTAVVLSLLFAALPPNREAARPDGSGPAWSPAVQPRVQVQGGAVCDVSWDGRAFQAAATRARAPGV